jgi:hypothetical protein
MMEQALGKALTTTTIGKNENQQQAGAATVHHNSDERLQAVLLFSQSKQTPAENPDVERTTLENAS